MFQPIKDAVRIASLDPSKLSAVVTLAESVMEWTDEEVDQLLEQLQGLWDELRDLRGFKPESEPDLGMDQESSPSDPVAGLENGLDRALQPVIHHLVVRELRRKLSSHLPRRSAGTDLTELGTGSQPSVQARTEPQALSLTASNFSAARNRSVEMLYRRSSPNSDLRNHLLRWLGTAGGEPQLDLWMELVCNDPPENRLSIGLAFAPLMQPNFQPSPTLLTGLLNRGTVHSQIAPAVFDLFNYYVIHKKVLQHPAAPRLAQLADLLGQLCGQLGRIEEGQFPERLAAPQINQLVSDSVALIVALCGTFALTNYPAAIPRLYQALQLRHRRVQTEAAAALAQLNDETGKKALIALAEQPIARLRVLAYAEELGFKHEISLELQGEIAMAESHLAIWLAEPDQMGLAPSDLELMDHRRMFWPGYDQPMPCFLFKYSYGKGPNAYSNIGLCGPMTYAFAADIRHLPVDEMYAAFAGWQTVHDEIFQMSHARAKQLHPQELRRLERSLEDEAFEALRIQAVGSFFGELVLIATAVHEEQPGTVIVDGHDSTWFEIGNPEAPVDWRVAYGIWRGKQLLHRFNASEQEG
jgi:hypothetical protein